MRKYLLVDLKGRSRRGMLIEVDRASVNRRLGGEIVSRNIWECADSPLLAVMINPLHAEFVRPRLFELRGDFDDKKINLQRVREVAVPEVSPEQKLVFAMYCIRSLAPEHIFAAWSERWLANIDRSVTGAQLARRELSRLAESTDETLATLSGFGARTQEIDSICDEESEFLRRARDVVDAAITLMEKPRQWRVTLAELVATATSNILDDSRRSEFADLAVHVIPTKPGRRRMPESRHLLRRYDDVSVRLPATQAYAVYQRGELRIKGRNPNLIKR